MNEEFELKLHRNMGGAGTSLLPYDPYEGDEHDGHRFRIRNRIRRQGFEQLKSADVMEYLMCFSIPRQDVRRLSEQLVEHFGNLHAMLESDPEDIYTVEGLSCFSADWLNALLHCLQSFHKIKEPDFISIKTFEQVRSLLPFLRIFYADCSVVQLCIDRYGHLAMCTPVQAGEHWVKDASNLPVMSGSMICNAQRVVLVVFRRGNDGFLHEEEQEFIEKYAHVLNHSGCDLSDVVFAGEDGMLSLRLNGLIVDAVKNECFDSIHEMYMHGTDDDAGPNEDKEVIFHEFI